MDVTYLKDVFAKSEVELEQKDFEEGNLDILGSSAMQFVTIGVMIAVGALVLAKIGENESFANDSVANETINKAKEGLETFADFLPVIAIIIVAVVILAYLVVFRQ